MTTVRSDNPNSVSADMVGSLAGITADSRQVKPGYLFAALPGARQDGRAFIEDAIAKGAKVILAPSGTRLPADAADVRLIETDNPRRQFALMAATFYGRQPETVVAVTGTNGKTSTVSFARQIWTLLGYQAASLGTLGIDAPSRRQYGSLTTPDPARLHADLADLAAAGVTHLAMEASSHGLDQHRLDGVRVSAAGFTNLSRDHLDYHGDMDNYLAAKARLLDCVLRPGGTAVINADAPEAAMLASRVTEAGRKVMTYGRQGRDLHLMSLETLGHGLKIVLRTNGGEHHLILPIAGIFQAYNVLCALGLAIAAGADAQAALGTLDRLQGVPGRMELVARHPNGAAIYVDYAHTPDALSTVLKALRPHTAGRLWVVFGCGGDRDRGKRPQMGAIAHELADMAIVTDDNPRTEDPASIRAEIMPACPGGVEIGDRAEAIRRAVAALKPDDVLVIAGKGHETGQIVGIEVRPFDDGEQARAAAAIAPEGRP